LSTERRHLRRGANALVAALVLATAGCRQDMHDQPKYQPLAKSRFFADGRASRPRVEGTVARGDLDLPPIVATGRSGDAPVRDVPLLLTKPLLLRGRERYDIYCAVCHDRAGYGSGMIVRRGFKAPPSFHIDRLRAEPAGYFFDVITNGFGQMPSYAAQVPVRDRWAIVAYLRALQLSQHATLDDVPPAERQALTSGVP
jgi:cbb3-type cytochrome c oxidase subunit III